MTREEIRRENARKLASRNGGKAALARLLQMEASQVSQLIGKTPIKNIGNSIARRIERAHNLPEGWLDVAHPETDIRDELDSSGLAGVPVQSTEPLGTNEAQAERGSLYGDDLDSSKRAVTDEPGDADRLRVVEASSTLRLQWVTDREAELLSEFRTLDVPEQEGVLDIARSFQRPAARVRANKA